MILKRCSIVVAILCLLGTSSVQGEQIRIDIENAQTAGGFYFTPVWVGLHDGGFDVFNAGSMAGPSLEALAEGGDTSLVSGDFGMAQANGIDQTVFGNSVGPPPFDPGESVSTIFNVDSSDNRYFSYASMVIPSNDAFIGNDDQLAYELFNASGDFNGTITIEVLASQIWDGGTEVNDINGGAAFSANGGTSVTEANGIGLIDLTDLNAFLGSGTAAGTTISNGLNPNDVVARITISAIPEPGSMGILAIAGLAGLVRRRRK